jgi:hypothetical protein
VINVQGNKIKGTKDKIILYKPDSQEKSNYNTEKNKT